MYLTSDSQSLSSLSLELYRIESEGKTLGGLMKRDPSNDLISSDQTNQ